MPAAELRSLGLPFAGLGEGREQRTVFGASVAASSLTKAILRHSTCDRLVLIPPGGQEKSAENEMKRWGVSEAADPRRFLFARPEEWGSRATSPGPCTLLHLRNRFFPAPAPVTFIHYTVSYANMLGELFLPLVLADTYPCDSIFCTSRDSRQAVQNLLDRASEHIRERTGVERRFQGRLDLVPLGVDTDLFRPRDKRELRRQLELPLDALVLLWVGRLSAADKMDLLPLLRVFRDLVRERPDRNLFLVLGGGGERHNYSALLSDAAQALGIADRVRIFPNFASNIRHLLFAASDVFVSPCDNPQETFGLTPIEAMACGVPQVVADWDGYKDTVVQGETGFLVPTWWTRCDSDLNAFAPFHAWEQDHLALAQSVVVDLEALHRDLATLIDNDALREEMGRKSRERALSHYAWPVVIAGCEAVWNELESVARSTPFMPGRPSGVMTPGYFDDFGAYASATLPGTTVVTLTPSGKAALGGKEQLPLFPYHEGLLDRELFQRILVAMKTAALFRRPSRLDGLAEGLAEGDPFRADQVRRHVLWLLKQGFLRLESPPPVSREPIR